MTLDNYLAEMRARVNPEIVDGLYRKALSGYELANNLAKHASQKEQGHVKPASRSDWIQGYIHSHLELEGLLINSPGEDVSGSTLELSDLDPNTMFPKA